MNVHSIERWIRPIYLYIVCIISVITLIIGLVTVLHLVIRTHVFDVQGSWYQDPTMDCMYIYSEGNTDYPLQRQHRTPEILADNLVDLTSEERTIVYERCVEQSEERIAGENQYNYANTMSNGLAMIIIALPILLIHTRFLRKEKA